MPKTEEQKCLDFGLRLMADSIREEFANAAITEYKAAALYFCDEGFRHAVANTDFVDAFENASKQYSKHRQEQSKYRDARDCPPAEINLSPDALAEAQKYINGDHPP